MSSSPERFIDLALNGSVLADEINDFVSVWHSSGSTEELHDFLGLTWQEYALWVRDPEFLTLIFSARHRGQSLVDAVNDNYLATQLVAEGAGRAARATQLRTWLGQQG
jgi:hypothetical protein